MKQIVSFLILILLFLPLGEIHPQEHRITQILDSGLLMLDNGNLVRLSDLDIPSSLDSTSEIAQMGQLVIKWEEQTILGRSFRVEEDSLQKGRYKSVRLYKYYPLAEDNIIIWFLRNGMAAYTGSPNKKEYEYMTQQQRAAFNKKNGIWRHLSYDRKFKVERIIENDDLPEYPDTLQSDTLKGGMPAFSPGDHELFLMPTAYTMPSGHGYFTDYELVFLNYTHALTSRTHIGGFFLFPLFPAFYETFNLGVKQNYFRSPAFGAALWGTWGPKTSSYTIGNTFSVGKPGHSLHLGIGLAGFFDHDNKNGSSSTELVFMAGYRVDISRKVSLIAEYSNSETLMDEADFNGLLTFGFRFRGKHLSWDLAAIRPLEKLEGDLVALPLLKATYFF